MTGINTTNVTYCLRQASPDSGNGSSRKVDVFGTNQYIFTLLDSTGTRRESRRPATSRR